MSLTAVTLGKKIKAGEVSVAEAAKACMDSIERYDSEYNCFVTVADREGVMK